MVESFLCLGCVYLRFLVKGLIREVNACLGIQQDVLANQ
jgi:hypothetical protein